MKLIDLFEQYVRIVFNKENEDKTEFKPEILNGITFTSSYLICRRHNFIEFVNLYNKANPKDTVEMHYEYSLKKEFDTKTDQFINTLLDIYVNRLFFYDNIYLFSICDKHLTFSLFGEAEGKNYWGLQVIDYADDNYVERSNTLLIDEEGKEEISLKDFLSAIADLYVDDIDERNYLFEHLLNELSNSVNNFLIILTNGERQS
jgi:hypothetical protein